MNQLIEFEKKLKEYGYKPTNQRKRVFEIILNNKAEHLSSKEIFELVSSKYPDVGIATVYRTIAILEEMNMIYGVDFGDGCIRYEIREEEEKHRHHHLICKGCNKITEVKEDLLDDVEKSILEKYGFSVTEHRVKFYGYCSKCSQNSKL